jgi:hypothetical protein
MARIAKDSGVITEHKLIVGIPEDSILNVAKDTPHTSLQWVRTGGPAGIAFN